MEWRNPRYNAAGSVDVDLLHPKYGWIPFTVDAADKFARFDVVALMRDISAQGQVAPYVPPPPASRRATMKPLTRAQFFRAMMETGHLSEQEAENAAAGGPIPGQFMAALNTLPQSERAAARIWLRSFTTVRRDNPVILLVFGRVQTPPTPAQLDTIWETYANL